MWGIEPVTNLPPWWDHTIRATASGDHGDDPFVFESVPFELPDTAVTASTIRLPLGQLLDDWVTQNVSLGKAAAKMGGDPKKVAVFLSRFEAPRKPGRHPLPLELLETVAELQTGAALSDA